jgi:excisionase family DNA binding protein
VPENRLPDKLQFVGRIRAAESIDCSPQFIDKLIRQKKLTAYHVGRKVVVRWSELLRLIEENEIR